MSAKNGLPKGKIVINDSKVHEPEESKGPGL